MSELFDNLDENSISVSKLNELSKKTLEKYLPIYWISGEISGLKIYTHYYFDLKDEDAKISCVLFASTVKSLDFKLENGQKIEVRGKVSIYTKTGSYQITVERVRQIGQGNLWLNYQKLLKRLESQGLFRAEFKKPLPFYPQSIGVITSKEGAVVRDVITTLKRRIPSIPIIIYHSLVQGPTAAMNVAQMIERANGLNQVDVLIICRGGGSMEDLWCFNEEVVAQAAFMSKIPIISAIGHETDTTILDFVADLRAPTPTAAAELVAKSRNEYLDILLRNNKNLNQAILDKLNQLNQSLDDYYQTISNLRPDYLLLEQRSVLNNLAQQLSQQTINRLNLYKVKFNNLKNLMNFNTQNYLSQNSQKLRIYQEKLTLLNPNNALARGYSITNDSQGKLIHSIAQVNVTDTINIRVQNGEIIAQVVRVQHSNQE